LNPRAYGGNTGGGFAVLRGAIDEVVVVRTARAASRSILCGFAAVAATREGCTAALHAELCLCDFVGSSGRYSLFLPARYVENECVCLIFCSQERVTG